MAESNNQSWVSYIGDYAGKELAGVAMVGAASAALGAGIASYRGSNLAGIGTMAAGLGALGSIAALGFGKEVFDETMSYLPQKKTSTSHVEKIQAERSASAKSEFSKDR